MFLAAAAAWISATGLHDIALAAESEGPSGDATRFGVQKKKMTLTKQYILFPIQNGSKKARIDLSIDGRNAREFDAEIAGSKDKVSFWTFLDVTAFKGKVATLSVDATTREGMGMIVQSNEIPGDEDFYSEPLRPQFHFSQKVGWNQALGDGGVRKTWGAEHGLLQLDKPQGLAASKPADGLVRLPRVD